MTVGGLCATLDEHMKMQMLYMDNLVSEKYFSEVFDDFLYLDSMADAPIFMNNVKCTGNESSLQDCNITWGLANAIILTTFLGSSTAKLGKQLLKNSKKNTILFHIFYTTLRATTSTTLLLYYYITLQSKSIKTFFINRKKKKAMIRNHTTSHTFDA